MNLPRSITDLKLAIIKYLATRPDGAARNEIVKACLQEKNNPHAKEFIAKTVSNMRVTKLTTRSTSGRGGVSLYYLSDYGRATLDNLDRVKITQAAGGSRPRQSNQGDLLATTPAPAPEPIRVNISETANNVADYITDLIEENRRYRELMITLHKTLTKELGLDAPTINGEPLE